MNTTWYPGYWIARAASVERSNRLIRERERRLMEAKARGEPLCERCEQPMGKGAWGRLCGFCVEVDRRVGLVA